MQKHAQSSLIETVDMAAFEEGNLGALHPHRAKLGKRLQANACAQRPAPVPRRHQERVGTAIHVEAPDEDAADAKSIRVSETMRV